MARPIAPEDMAVLADLLAALPTLGACRVTIADHCAELATLAPMLTPALTRDRQVIV